MKQKYKKRNGKNLSGYQQRLVDLERLQTKYDRHMELVLEKFKEFHVAEVTRQRERYEAIIDALLNCSKSAKINNN